MARRFSCTIHPSRNAKNNDLPNRLYQRGRSQEETRRAKRQSPMAVPSRTAKRVAATVRGMWMIVAQSIEYKSPTSKPVSCESGYQNGKYHSKCGAQNIAPKPCELDLGPSSRSTAARKSRIARRALKVTWCSQRWNKAGEIRGAIPHGPEVAETQYQRKEKEGKQPTRAWYAISDSQSLSPHALMPNEVRHFLTAGYTT